MNKHYPRPCHYSSGFPLNVKSSSASTCFSQHSYHQKQPSRNSAPTLPPNAMESSSDQALLPFISNLRKSHLMSMPYEIRQNILKFACHGTIKIRIQLETRYIEAYIASYNIPEHSILQVCRVMHDEAHPILLNQISLQIDCSSTKYCMVDNPDGTMSRMLLGSGSTEFLKKACHSLKQVSFTIDDELRNASLLDDCRFTTCFPALKELHLGDLSPWAMWFCTARISDVRSISIENGMTVSWGGSQALRCRTRFFNQTKRIMTDTDRHFRLTFNVDLVDCDEEPTTVRRTVSFCSLNVQEADFHPEG